jgi:hypothetical protein
MRPGKVSGPDAAGGNKSWLAAPSHPIARALLGYLNVGVAATGAAGAVALHSWPVFALGSAAYAALVAWDLVSDKKPQNAYASERRTLDSANAYTDPSARAAVTTVHHARMEIARVLGEAPQEVQVHMTDTLASLGDIEERVARLADRAEYIAQYLARTNLAGVHHDIEMLTERVRSTKNPAARTQFEAALAARTEHLSTLQELSGTHERIGASMLNIAVSLQAIPPKIVKMGALDGDAMDSLSGDVEHDLQRMSGEMKTLEETLKSLGEIGPNYP